MVFLNTRAYCTSNMTNIIEGKSMKQIKKTSVATALGAVVIGSLASTVAVADVNPFGMQALEWAAQYGNKINAVIPIAASYRHSAQNIAFHEIGRQAIMADPNWKKGNYYAKKS